MENDSTAKPSAVPARGRLTIGPQVANLPHKDGLFLKISLSPALSVAYGHRTVNCRNFPFNTRTCHTTKEINSLMAAGGIG
jgi:hypothetical protein